MIRYFIGIFLMLLGLLFGYTHAGGKLGDLLHLSELIIIGSVILGAVTCSFGFGRFCGMIWDGIFRSHTIDSARRAANIKICEGASVFSICGGLAAILLGLIITLGSWGHPPDSDAEKLGACATGILWGLFFFVVLFQPLKYRFLNHAGQAGAAEER